MPPLHLDKQASPKNLSSLPHVVILGGGFAGLAAGRALAKYPIKSPSLTKRIITFFNRFYIRLRRLDFLPPTLRSLYGIFFLVSLI